MPTGTVWRENGEAGRERGGGEAGWIRIVIVLSHLSSCCMLSPLLHAVGLFFGHPGNHDDSSETSVLSDSTDDSASGDIIEKLILQWVSR